MTDVNIDIITKWPELLHDRCKECPDVDINSNISENFPGIHVSCETVSLFLFWGVKDVLYTVHTNSFEVHKGDN